MRNSSLVPKLGKDAAALRMNGIGYCFPTAPLLVVVDSGCAEPTLAVFADPGAFPDDEACRRALLIVLAHEIIMEQGDDRKKPYNGLQSLTAIAPSPLPSLIAFFITQTSLNRLTGPDGRTSKEVGGCVTWYRLAWHSPWKARERSKHI
jgi:hypothetical protein